MCKLNFIGTIIDYKYYSTKYFTVRVFNGKSNFEIYLGVRNKGIKVLLKSFKNIKNNFNLKAKVDEGKYIQIQCLPELKKEAMIFMFSIMKEFKKEKL